MMFYSMMHVYRRASMFDMKVDRFSSFISGESHCLLGWASQGWRRSLEQEHVSEEDESQVQVAKTYGETDCQELRSWSSYWCWQDPATSIAVVVEKLETKKDA